MKKTITKEQLRIICIGFHKWFRIADCKDDADILMYKAISKLDVKEYTQAMADALKEADIEIM